MKVPRKREANGRYALAYSEHDARLRDNASSERWKIRNAVRRREYQKKWREENPERLRKYQRKYHGIPEPTRPCPEHCESCGMAFSAQKGKEARIDHDHTTGKFRGWLCRNCNCGLGMLGDFAESVRKILAYLVRK